MVYETFLNTIHSMVQERLRGQANVTLRRVLKNNGLLLDGLTIASPCARLSPTVYLNSYYQEAEEGLPLSVITEQILLLCEEGPDIPDTFADDLKNFDAVRNRIAYKLINAGDNEILLSQIPHFLYLDLAIVFYLIVSENEEGQMTALIHYEHLEIWDITREELGELAEQNTRLLMPHCIIPLMEMMSELELPLPFPRQLIPPVPVYVLTNDRGINGAAALLYPHILKDFSEQLKDDLLVIPSSIHEVLLIPLGEAFSLPTLKRFLSHTNQSNIPLEDRLSNHIYCYSRRQSCLYLPSDSSLSPAFPAGDERLNPQ